MDNLPLKTLKVSGADAEIFLQNFITCDSKQLTVQPLFAAACNQKGRIIANFWIWRDQQNTFYLQLPSSMTDILIAHLKKYVFRSDVSFEYNNQQPSSLPRIDVIWITPPISEEIIPQMINMEKHGGISFTKGCYLGQEIIARTQHLGKLKRHLQIFILKEKQDIKIGDAITDKTQQKVGIIVAIQDQKIFAVVEDRTLDSELYWQEYLLASREHHGPEDSR